MSLLAAERIKLVTTRSPWWCAVIALALAIGISVLFTLHGGGDRPLTVANTQLGVQQFGFVVVMVMAALAVTTEYRFGTIKATFTAAPNRFAVLLAKTGLVAFGAAVIGEIAAFGALGAAILVRPSAHLSLATPADWRAVAGSGLVYAIAAVLALAVGTLIRHTAGAIALLLIYALIGEPLIAQIPGIGPGIHRWLPFAMADNFQGATGRAVVPGGAALSPWWSLAYFAGIAVLLSIIAMVVANRRDA
ncbi:MAG: ABC transporter permease [Sciscionella sp.]